MILVGVVETIAEAAVETIAEVAVVVEMIAEVVVEMIAEAAVEMIAEAAVETIAEKVAETIASLVAFNAPRPLNDTSNANVKKRVSPRQESVRKPLLLIQGRLQVKRQPKFERASTPFMHPSLVVVEYVRQE
jgi:hypothetical protein